MNTRYVSMNIRRLSGFVFISMLLLVNTVFAQNFYENLQGFILQIAIAGFVLLILNGIAMGMAMRFSASTLLPKIAMFFSGLIFIIGMVDSFTGVSIPSGFFGVIIILLFVTIFLFIGQIVALYVQKNMFENPSKFFEHLRVGWSTKRSTRLGILAEEQTVEMERKYVIETAEILTFFENNATIYHDLKNMPLIKAALTKMKVPDLWVAIKRMFKDAEDALKTMESVITGQLIRDELVILEKKHEELKSYSYDRIGNELRELFAKDLKEKYGELGAYDYTLLDAMQNSILELEKQYDKDDNKKQLKKKLEELKKKIAEGEKELINILNGMKPTIERQLSRIKAQAELDEVASHKEEEPPEVEKAKATPDKQPDEGLSDTPLVEPKDEKDSEEEEK